MTITSVLLMVWLTLSCQNCFAMEVQDHSNMSVSMDCCPSSDMQDNMDKDDQPNIMVGNCATANLISQPVVAEEINLQLEDQQIGLASVHATDYFSSASSGNASFKYQSLIAFSQTLFSSYRILLI